MSTVTHDEVCVQILETLYNLARQEPSSWGIDRDAMLRTLGIPERDMDYCMVYLEQRGLIALTRAVIVPWLWARMTSFGMDVVENKEQYKQRFPFLRAGTKA